MVYPMIEMKPGRELDAFVADNDNFKAKLSVARLKQSKPWVCSFCGFDGATPERPVKTEVFNLFVCSVCSQEDPEFFKWLWAHCLEDAHAQLLEKLRETRKRLVCYRAALLAVFVVNVLLFLFKH